MTNEELVIKFINNYDLNKLLISDANAHLFGTDMQTSCFGAQCNLTPFGQCATFEHNVRSSTNTILATTNDGREYVGSLHMVHSSQEARLPPNSYLIHSLCVVASFRNRGVGKMLLDKAKSLGCVLVLDVLCVKAEKYENVPAAVLLERRFANVSRFYEKNGFTRASGSEDSEIITYEWKPRRLSPSSDTSSFRKS